MGKKGLSNPITYPPFSKTLDVMALFGVGLDGNEENRTTNPLTQYLGVVLCSISVIFGTQKIFQKIGWTVAPSVRNFFTGRDYDSARSCPKRKGNGEVQRNPYMYAKMKRAHNGFYDCVFIGTRVLPEKFSRVPLIG